tara:strand:- start:1168 stop:1467 length:300 start_codon:yes stop_codon:yes gene_type:complete
LLEASAFTKTGGWKIDTQHYLQMGGNYLLAHGMGKPVEDAETLVNLPAPDTWNVWVRNIETVHKLSDLRALLVLKNLRHNENGLSVKAKMTTEVDYLFI